MKINNETSIELMNLISSDAANIENVMNYVMYIITVPIKTTIILWVLFSQAGNTIFYGVFVCSIFVLILIYLSRFLSRYW
jgi:hypothetical protein